MGVQSIKGADPSTNGQGGKQFASFWDLIGLFADSELGPDFLAVMREAGQQMGGISLGGPSSAYGLAIHGEGIGGRSQAASPDPRREHLFERLNADLREQPAIQGPTRSQKQTRTKEFSQEHDVFLARTRSRLRYCCNGTTEQQ
jgi:hypothetical protein